MALTATMRRFEIELADSDRGVYEALDLRVAQHPSESERYLVARVPFMVPPPGGPSAYRLRTATSAHGLSTLEAVARALGALEGGVVERALVDALELFQTRLLWLRGSINRDEVVGGLPAHVRRQDGLGVKPL